METNISQLEALGDPTRRKIMERLRQGPCSVNELVCTVQVSQPAVSQQLRVLRQAGLVRVDRQAQRRIYSLDPQGWAELHAYVESFWEALLGAYQVAAEQKAKEETTYD